ncbi:hypothetical protein RhiLY_09536 [Ceratobasidium sp. AG-Ba]|nr:hypothetical protein RhiLY_09536 [Ceratobasidium sp. AG-Ba]
MSDKEPAVSGKRSRTRTPGGLELDIDMATKKAKRDQTARNKVVNAGAKVLQHGESAFEVPMSDGNKEVLAPPKPKPRPKPKPVVTPESSKLTGSKGKAWRKKHLMLISIRDEVPADKLECFPDDELEVIWKGGEGAALTFLAFMDTEDTEPVPRPATSVAKPAGAPSKAPAKPIVRNKAAPPAAEPNARLPATTPKPKRLVAPSLMKSTITSIGSPRVAIEEAETQSRLAAVSPIINRQKRNLSLERGEPAPKRTQPTTSAAQTSSSSVHDSCSSALTPKSHNISIKLVGSFGRFCLARAVPVLGNPLDDSQSEPEIAGLGDGTSEEYVPGAMDEHEESEEVVAPVVKKKQSSAGKKKAKASNRPTTAKFKETGHDAIIDIAVERAIVLLAHRGFWIEERPFILTIHKAWDYALDRLAFEPDEWPIESGHITVIRARIGSFRGRGCTRIKDCFTGVYDLDITDSRDIPVIKERAKNLLPVRFHQDPAVPAGSEMGYFRHKFLAKATYLTFFTGEKAPGLAFPEDFNLIVPEIVAFVCTQMEDLFERFAEDGCYVKEKRRKAGNNDNEEPEPEPEQETPAAKRSVAKRLKTIYERHLADLRSFEQNRPGIFVVWQVQFSNSVRALAGQQQQGQIVPKKVGSLDASAFAGEPDLTPEEVAEQLAAALLAPGSLSIPSAFPTKSRASTVLASSNPSSHAAKRRTPSVLNSLNPPAIPSKSRAPGAVPVFKADLTSRRVDNTLVAPSWPVRQALEPAPPSTDEIESDKEPTIVAMKDGRRFQSLDDDRDIPETEEDANPPPSRRGTVQQAEDEEEEETEAEETGGKPVEEEEDEEEADGALEQNIDSGENVEQAREARAEYEARGEVEDTKDSTDGSNLSGTLDGRQVVAGHELEGTSVEETDSTEGTRAVEDDGTADGMGEATTVVRDPGAVKASVPSPHDSSSGLSDLDNDQEDALPAPDLHKSLPRSTRQQTAIARQLEALPQRDNVEPKGKAKEAANNSAATAAPKKAGTGGKKASNNAGKRRK